MLCMGISQVIVRYSTQATCNNSIQLYKYLLRQCQKLPSGPKEHYRHMIKQVYKISNNLY